MNKCIILHFLIQNRLLSHLLIKNKVKIDYNNIFYFILMENVRYKIKSHKNFSYFKTY